MEQVLTRTGELGDFLRTRRAAAHARRRRRSASYGARRVPGLRREELAMLAGVSVTYYTRLEQGQSVERVRLGDRRDRSRPVPRRGRAGAPARPREAVRTQGAPPRAAGPAPPRDQDPDRGDERRPGGGTRAVHRRPGLEPARACAGGRARRLRRPGPGRHAAEPDQDVVPGPAHARAVRRLGRRGAPSSRLAAAGGRTAPGRPGAGRAGRGAVHRQPGLRGPLGQAPGPQLHQRHASGSTTPRSGASSSASRCCTCPTTPAFGC